jgi:hypothetical protein
MHIDYVKISCKEDVHICHTNFAKKWNEICMIQLAGGKHMENNCFLRTLKFEMLFLMSWWFLGGVLCSWSEFFLWNEAFVWVLVEVGAVRRWAKLVILRCRSHRRQRDEGDGANPIP